MELILKIFEHAMELADEWDYEELDRDESDSDESDSGDADNSSSLSMRDLPTLLILTAICHKIREIGISTPRLWGTVDPTIPSLANLFLERCNYDPHTLTIISPRLKKTDLLQLEGLTFGNLRSVFFHGSSNDLGRIVPIFQRATNLSTLAVRVMEVAGFQFPWHPSSPIPHLSSLRLRRLSINWTSPLLRNLSQLILDFSFYSPSGETLIGIEKFLTALANCPDLEKLELIHVGPNPRSNRNKCHTVVQLRRLQSLFLLINNASAVGCILSHISYPASASVRVSTSVEEGADIPGSISQFLPHGNADILRHWQMS